MSLRSEIPDDQPASPPWVEPLREAIKEDTRLTDGRLPAGQKWSHQRIRSLEILSYLSDQYADADQADASKNTVEITVSDLIGTGEFSVRRKTLRKDLTQLVECGYLEKDTTSTSHTYRVADSWVNNAGGEDELTIAAGSETLDSDLVASSTQESQTPPVEAPRNYAQAATLFREAAANLTPRRRIVASVCGYSGPLVGIFGVLVMVAGWNVDPNLVAAGESSVYAGVTLLIGWLWLLFVGLVDGVSAPRNFT